MTEHNGDSVPSEDALIEQIARRRNDDDFMRRLAQRVEEDGPILARLAAGDQHQCRYPAPNNQGFPPNQCLDCGGWIIAAPDLHPAPRPLTDDNTAPDQPSARWRPDRRLGFPRGTVGLSLVFIAFIAWQWWSVPLGVAGVALMAWSVEMSKAATSSNASYMAGES